MDSPNAPLAALDVLRTVEFKLGLKGYNVDEVDEFLERAAVEAEHLKDQLRQQQQQLRQAAERISQLEVERRAGAVSASTVSAAAPPPAPAAAPAAPAVPVAAAAAGAEQVARMITLAQQFVDQTQREAETRGRELTVAAQEKAKEIVAEAQNRAQDEVTRLNGLKQRLSEDVDKLARQVDLERTRLRTQLSEFLRWVEENLQAPAPPSTPTPVVESPAAEPAVEAPRAPVLSPPPPVISPAVSPATVPPPAPARNAPATIGQALSFDTEDRP